MVKLKGSTIIETIVAILIISVCFEIAIISLAKLYLSDNTQDIINAKYLVENEMYNTINNDDFLSNEKKLGKYVIVKKVHSYKRINRLKLIRFEVFKLDKVIFKKRKLIKVNAY